VDIPDINVWLALLDPNHFHHAAASRYWEDHPESELAFSRITMLGLLRLSTQPRVLSRTLSASEAWEIYQSYLAQPQIHFLAEPETTEWHFSSLTAKAALPHRLWTDAYLAAFAIAGGCQLVSFDADFEQFPGLDFLHLSA
jgi:toxin-antitoxin system PIN domain toxin